MESVRDGQSRRQFEAFVAETADGLFHTGYLMTGNAGETEDAVQETFIRAAAWLALVSKVPAASGRPLVSSKTTTFSPRS